VSHVEAYPIIIDDLAGKRLGGEYETDHNICIGDDPS
jgi:hypothetical protein